jgi:hypothetical protein
MKLAPAAALVLASSIALAFAQERTKPKAPATFDELHAAVKTHHDAGRIGAAFKAAQDLVGMLALERGERIRAALPAAPAGYEKVQPTDEERAQAGANPFLGAMAAGIGNVVEQEYRSTSGAQSIRVTVTADSPMMGFAKMMFENPAMLGPEAELVKYEQCKAILKKEGNTWGLQLVIDNTLIDASFGAESDEFALKMFDQAAVTALQSVISG